MSYKLKTLIVFDTNSLRSTSEKEVAYSVFDFGRPYRVIEEFISTNRLTDDVKIAIPLWVIEELKDQKNKQYQKDLEDLSRITTRLNGLPGHSDIKIPKTTFDCKAYIEKQALLYLSAKSIFLLEIKEEIAKDVLKSMMERVMRDEKMKKPFAHSGKYKDAGFKDNLVWESLMNFEGLVDFDKVIFLTKDGDYNNCEYEFRAKWNKHIDIEKDENNVIVKISADYENYIFERSIYDFAQSEYYAQYLYEELKNKSMITVNGYEYPIENFVIKDICKYVKRDHIAEDDIENIYITSAVDIHFTANKKKKVQQVQASTMLWDDETKEIVSTEYDYLLI